MREFDRETADPTILHAYETARFERRSPQLEMAARVIRAFGYGGVVPVFFIPSRIQMAYLHAWLAFAAAAIITELVLMVVLRPHADRSRMAMVTLAVVGVITLVMAVLILLLMVVFHP